MSAPAGSPITAEYWDRPLVTSMLDRGDLGALLLAITEEFGLSQRALGELAGFSQTQVSQYINAVHKATMENWARFANRMNLPPSARFRLGLSAPDGASGHPLPDVKVHKILRLAEHIGRTGDTSVLSIWRELTRPGSPAEPWERLARIIGEPAPQAPVLDRMAARTRGFYLVAAKLPARLVIRGLTAHVRDIVLLLDASDDEDLRRSLTVVGGETSYLGACCDVDLGQAAGALDLLDTTAAAAERGKDPLLAAMAVDGQSHFEAFRGHPRRALELVGQARSGCLAADNSTGTVAYLWLHTAEAYAALGEIGQAARAWERAEDLYARTDLATDRNWVRLWLSRDCFDSVRAVIFAATRRPKEAAVCADRVATRLAGQDGKTDAIALLNAALAQARVGLHVPAAVTGTHALHAVRSSEASSCLPRAGELAALIREHPARSPKTGAFFRDLELTAQQLDGSRQS